MKPAMIIDLRRCTGCLACVEACMTENIVRWREDGTYVLPENVVAYTRTRSRTVTYGDTMRKVFIQCLHCEDPPCVFVCPTGASYKSEEGVVLIDDEICIKCKYCIYACPYGVRTMLETPMEGTILHEHALKVGVPDKCTFCYHRKRGESLWTPACVEGCPYHARLFGDLDDPDDTVTVLVETGIAAMPREDLGTSPKLFYIPRRGAFEIVKYPVRRKDELITYPVWSKIKDTFVKTLANIAIAAGVLLGAIHIVREKLKEGGEE